MAISPRNNSDHWKFQRALNVLVQEDPTIQIKAKSIGGQTILSGMSDLHLEIICGRILREFNIQLDVSEPTVIYLETIRKRAQGEGKYIRQTGGSGNYAHCRLRIEPNEPGKGYEFINNIKDQAIRTPYITPIDEGVQDALEHGILAGHPMVDIKVTLFDGSYHEEDSNEMAFKIAGANAFKDAARKALPILLEPVMHVEVTVPEEYLGAIIGDLNSRRGRIEDVEQEATGSYVIKTAIALAAMFGYERDICSNTQGQASYSMRFAGYEAVSPRGGPGDEDPYVSANKPARPKAGDGSAAVQLFAVGRKQ